MVSAQITETAMTTIKMPQTGYQGSQAKPTTALITPRITPTVRAQMAPLKSESPAMNTTMPRIRWIQPHVVRSNWNTYSFVAT